MEQEEIDIIIIRGAPGSGKSQTAKGLAQFFPKGVRMEVDTIRQMVISVDWKNQAEHINILGLSAKMAHEFLVLGFKPIIVVDTFSGDKVLKYLQDLLQLNKELVIKIFGLYVTEDELKKRLEKRIDGEFKDLKICLRLNRDVLKFKYENEFQINTTGLLPNDSAKIIFNTLFER
jgi:hypothetical protein